MEINLTSTEMNFEIHRLHIAVSTQDRARLSDALRRVDKLITNFQDERFFRTVLAINLKL